jgi:acetyltransferase-like isoleucine patch superfamily enzyme
VILYKVARKLGLIKNIIVNSYLLKINNVLTEGKLIINGKILIRNEGTIKLSDNVKINSSYSANPIGGQGLTSLMVKKNAELIIDSNVGISNSAICVHKFVYIGPNVLIGGGCKIYDTDFHSLGFKDRIVNGDVDIKVSPVFIEEGCFIGAGTTILKGVRVGRFSVIGAGSVVTKDIPENEIWAGNPARFIKKIDRR